MKKLLLLGSIVMLSVSVFAGENASASSPVIVRDCDDRTPTSVEFFVEQRTFANGGVRVISVDTNGEPACCSSHVIIYMPDKDQPMTSKCFHIATSTDGLGFNGTNLAHVKASYDPKGGLTLKLPILIYDGETGGTIDKTATLLINQALQTVQAK